VEKDLHDLANQSGHPIIRFKETCLMG